VIRDAVIFAVGMIAIAGAWYVRNLITAGVIVPPTGWTWLAQRTIANVFTFIGDVRFLPAGIAFVGGVIYAVWRIRHDEPSRLLLIFFVPFFLVWWALVSYDPRFLLVITALVAVMGAKALYDGMAQLGRVPLVRIGIISAIVLLTGYVAWGAVDHKNELIRRPFLDFNAKRRITHGTRYEAIQYLQSIPAGARVWTTDGFVPYFLTDERYLTVTHGNFPEREQIRGYDYLVTTPSDPVTGWLSGQPLLAEFGGYRVYRLNESE
jgi:hypothetical protein